MPFIIIRNDITKVKADAIVNTANPAPVIGRGTEYALYNAAGTKALLEARQEIGELTPGTAAATPAFDLDARYIIHVCGVPWKGGGHGETDILKRCYESALSLAYEKGCESIAFPLLSTGFYRFPAKLGMQIAADAFTHFLEEHEMEITLAVFDDFSTKVSGELADEVKSFVDDSYVDNALKEEYMNVPKAGAPVSYASAMPQLGSAFMPQAARELQSPVSHMASDEEAVADKKQKKHSRKKENKNASPMERFFKLSEKKSARESFPAAGDNACFTATQETCDELAEPSLEDTLKSIYSESFEKHLQQLVNKKGLKNSEVYSAANISKQYFSKLLKGQVRPSKEKVLALSVGLRLNLDETVDFLRIAGYALSPISQTDAVVRYFILHEDYNVIKIDIVLFDYGLDPLSKN